MKLSLSQAAEQLGKTRRQIRYMIQQERLRARKDGGRWVVESDDLPLSDGSRAADARRDARLREAVDNALQPRRKNPYRLQDLRAVAIAVPLYQQCRETLGEESLSTRELRNALDQLAMGYHRYVWSEKRDAYSAARDAASRAAIALLLANTAEALEMQNEIEAELMPAITGVLRRSENRKQRV